MIDIDGFKTNAKDAYLDNKILLGISRHENMNDLLKDKDAPYWCFEYAKYVMNKRWIDVESVIKKDKYYWRCYKKHFGI